MSEATPTGLTIPRRFTTAGADPFEGIPFTRRRSAIFNTDGSVIFEMNDVEVPDTWTQVAVDILVSKYFRKASVPQVGEDGTPLTGEDGAPVLGSETSARQWALRLSNAWRIWGERGGYFATPEDAEAFRDELAYMLMTQMGSPNSPQHFNTGLFEAYGIVSDPEGNWYVDPETGETRESAHRYERSAVNACFILEVEDELVGPGSIFEYIQNEARLFKSGSGSGANLSKIRGKGERLSGGGTSSGVMSFMRVADRAAGAIKSGGTTRRAAKMVILDADHPEIEDFIWCKVREEEKVAALVAGGYPSDWNGEAYDTVAFQNGNNSVRLPAGFMEAARSDKEWNLIARTSGEVMKTLPARKVWDDIADAAWRCADPGVQFDDLLNDWNTAANDARLRGTNPCSEYTHIDNTACNLASLNLVKYFDDDKQVFDFETFRHAVRLFTIVLEISVYMSHYPAEVVARNSFEHRTLGLGYANIGALLMRAGLPYDSPEGLAAIGAITALMHDTAYATSAEMAAAVGPCLAWGRNVEPMSRVLRNHARAAWGTRLPESGLGGYEDLAVVPQGIDHDVLRRTPFRNLSDAVTVAAREMLQGIDGPGYRNMQATVEAPTGTIGLQMDCDTTGIEPDFALVKFKKLAGGGYMKIVNNSVRPALKSLGYDKGQIKRILAHAIGTQSLDGPTAVNRGSLAAKGLPARAIERVEAQLKAVTELSMAFSTYVVGVDVLEEMGLTAEQYTAPEFNLLEHLGYSKTECATSSEVICGHGTVEGAADLKPEHLPVFDTANYCGDGTRVIAWQGHVRALGAVAPHLSGSASKTINLPNEATVDEIRAAYELSYDLGVKCAAVYRDGSKLSQVLSSQKAKEDDAETAAALEEIVNVVTTTVLREIEPGESPTQYYHGTTPPKFKLPTERVSRTWKFTVGNQEVFLTAGQYDDGTLGEVWITLGNGKEGTLTSSILHSFAVSISMGLQYGVPLERFVDMFVWHSFQPAGVVTGHRNLKMATSIMDAIFKVLAFTYLGREDLVQVPEPRPARAAFLSDGETGLVPQRTPAPTAPAALSKVASGKGLDLHPVTAATTTDADPAAHSVETRQEPGRTQTGAMFASGEACSNCGGQMVKSGTCSRCLNCGETSGCS